MTESLGNLGSSRSCSDSTRHLLKAESRRGRTEEDPTHEALHTSRPASPVPVRLVFSLPSLALGRPGHMTTPVLHRVRTSFFPLHCDQKAPRAISACETLCNFIYHFHFFYFLLTKPLLPSLSPPPPSLHPQPSLPPPPPARLFPPHAAPASLPLDQG